MSDTIATRWAAVKGDVEAACVRADRDPASVTIVAVAKTHPVSSILEAITAGATDIGENYAQELAAKRTEVLAAIGPAARWHFIGRLQRNKVKLVVNTELIHAVDSVELGEEIAKRAAMAGTTQQGVLLVVNIGGEASKSGVTLDTAPAVAAALARVTGLRLDGFMTMPPPSDDPEASRPAFTALAALRDRLRDDVGLPLPTLSMGMSSDYGVAIACGASHVRIGTAIFGGRPV